MAQVRVECLDHFGLMASVIKDVGLMNMIARQLVPDEQDVIPPGDAVAGMIRTGVGLAHRPCS
jgi:hypothetical protein